MGHLTRKTTRRDFPLDGRQLLELDMGPKPRGSAFRDEDELRQAWEANRDEFLQRYAFRLHHAGWRPDAYWYLEAPEELWVADDPVTDEGDGPAQRARLRWLLDHDAFLPGELDAMKRRAKRDPNGYAAAAWRVVSGND